MCTIGATASARLAWRVEWFVPEEAMAVIPKGSTASEATTMHSACTSYQSCPNPMVFPLLYLRNRNKLVEVLDVFLPCKPLCGVHHSRAT